eukprot:5373626-Pleurochrysis_carterae.AAC.8
MRSKVPISEQLELDWVQSCVSPRARTDLHAYTSANIIDATRERHKTTHKCAYDTLSSALVGRGGANSL